MVHCQIRVLHEKCACIFQCVFLSFSRQNMQNRHILSPLWEGGVQSGAGWVSLGFREVFARFSPGFREVFARFLRGFREVFASKKFY